MLGAALVKAEKLSVDQDLPPTHTHISTHTRRGHLHTHTHKHGEEIKLQLCASTASYNFAAVFFFHFLPIPSYNHSFSAIFAIFIRCNFWVFPLAMFCHAP